MYVHDNPDFTRMIHENFWIVLSHALASHKAADLLNKRFEGEWKYLRKTIFDLSERRANRALLEMAIQLRLLDDKERISEILRQIGTRPLGYIFDGDEQRKDLHFRDMTNKIIHASRFEWSLADADRPTVIMHSQEPERWKLAELRLFDLMGFVGMLMH